MNRQQANKEILRIILEYVEAYPDQRFTQILSNLDVVSQMATGILKDEYYMESEELLKRVAKTISTNNY